MYAHSECVSLRGEGDGDFKSVHICGIYRNMYEFERERAES